MTTWNLIRLNVERYERLLRHPDLHPSARPKIERLLAEERAKIGGAPLAEPRQSQDDDHQ